MSASQLGLASGCVIVALKAYTVRYLWNFPLNHGLGYFFGVAVPPGFYNGAGIGWLRCYRSLLVAQWLLVAGVFMAVLMSSRWSQMPILAPVDVISFFALIGGFMLWARRAVGVSPTTLPRAVVPLTARRLANYISWPAEALMAALVAASWLLLYSGGGTHGNWGWPVVSTYVVLALLPGKIILVRNSFPLPTERTEEYHRWLDTQRRFSLRMMDAMRWQVIAVLAGYAVLHGWPGAQSLTWIRWLSLAVSGAVFAAMMVILFRGMARSAAMGRDLPPVGSFQSPFRPASLFLRGGLPWSIAYCAGLGALIIYFQN
jgi:hypothetical protein